MMLLLLAAIAIATAPVSSPSSASPPSPGDRAFSAGRFDEALAAYTVAAARNPDDFDARLGLGTLELYSNQLALARRDLNAALALHPHDAYVRQRLGIIAQREGAPGVFVIDMHGAPEIDVPLLTINPLPTLHVNVNGHELTLFIDTGATTIDLSPEAGQAVGAQVTAEAQGVFAGGKAAGVSKTSLAQVQLGGLTVTNVPAEMIAGLSSLALDGKHVDGAIGAQFLYHFLSTIDYRRKLLVLRPASDSAAFEAAAAKRGADLQPIWLVGDHFIFARAHINDAPEALFNIDTGGAGIGVQLTEAALDAAFVAPNIAAAQVVHGGGGDVKAVPFQAQVTFGTLTERNVHGVVFPEGDQYGLFPFTVAGTLTHEFFRSTALTFDFVAMRMLAE